jgi:hypothetical protein
LRSDTALAVEPAQTVPLSGQLSILEPIAHAFLPITAASRGSLARSAMNGDRSPAVPFPTPSLKGTGCCGPHAPPNNHPWPRHHPTTTEMLRRLSACGAAGQPSHNPGRRAVPHLGYGAAQLANWILILLERRGRSPAGASLPVPRPPWRSPRSAMRRWRSDGVSLLR